MAKAQFLPYDHVTYPAGEMIERSRQFYEWADKRRTVRGFSDKSVPRTVVEHLIQTASTAPSGAHKQPWKFCIVGNTDLKKKIREAAEEEEYTNYHGRMSEQWLQDLAYLGTDWHKPFLETAPWLIVVFKEIYRDENGEKVNNYYVNESVGLACGFLLLAIHNAGLVALTHTPSPMNFLSDLLQRPKNERPFLLIPVGYPAKKVKVPDLQRRPLAEVAEFYE